MEVRCIPSLLQHLAVRLPHHVSWVHNGCSEDPRAGNGGRHERARPKSEAAWCNVIASRCISRQKAAGSRGKTALISIKRYVGSGACYREFPRMSLLGSSVNRGNALPRE